ncbi:MAG: 6-bladed beta-propeller [Odoribacter splanchnicus]|uniref:6-bladed beta-propeller n=1 Tax=Odoribacter splanchnicus TaxID=28118 RepID=UPI001584AE30|nr:6-bladed beta-propeller [Odoribacter splanchnicus]MBV4401977.1 6-bladed beta-propeller [Odoribacter splanchnicus]MBV4410694.1 6-bladed beta-propeller [Odoribacter splanchnicus]NUN83347.1 6-bladed beta-propeller [Odoribacter splanchnicus]
MTGKLHNTIGRRGRGPFEYLHLDDYCITKNKNILILDGSSKKNDHLHLLRDANCSARITFFCRLF